MLFLYASYRPYSSYRPYPSSYPSYSSSSSTYSSIASANIPDFFDKIPQEAQENLVEKIKALLERLDKQTNVDRERTIQDVLGYIREALKSNPEDKKIKDLEDAIEKLQTDKGNLEIERSSAEHNWSISPAGENKDKLYQLYVEKKGLVTQKSVELNTKTSELSRLKSKTPASKADTTFNSFKTEFRKATDVAPIVSFLHKMQEALHGASTATRIEPLRPGSTTKAQNIDYNAAYICVWVVQNLANKIAGYSGTRQNFVNFVTTELSTLFNQVHQIGDASSQAESLIQDLKGAVQQLIASDTYDKEPSNIVFIIRDFFGSIMPQHRDELSKAVTKKTENIQDILNALHGTGTKPPYIIKESEEEKKKKEAEDEKKKDAEVKGAQKDMLAEISKITEPLGLNFADLVK